MRPPHRGAAVWKGHDRPAPRGRDTGGFGSERLGRPRARDAKSPAISSQRSQSRGSWGRNGGSARGMRETQCVLSRFPPRFRSLREPRGNQGQRNTRQRRACAKKRQEARRLRLRGPEPAGQVGPTIQRRKQAAQAWSPQKKLDGDWRRGQSFGRFRSGFLSPGNCRRQYIAGQSPA